MKSLAELQALRDEMKDKIGIRAESDMQMRVVVGMATCGIAAGARSVLAAFADEITKRRLNDVALAQTDCIGICQYEPFVEVYDANGAKTTYVNMVPDKVAKIVDEHLVNGKPVTEYTIGAVVK